MASATKRSTRWPACSAVAVMRIGREGDGSLGGCHAGCGITRFGAWGEAVEMGEAMRALKIAVIVMGVLIVAGTIVLIVGVAPVGDRRRRPWLRAARRGDGGAGGAGGDAHPGIAAVQDRLALQLQGGGGDRVVLVDPRTGAVAGRISLAR